MKTNENLVHVKFERSEALESKKDILTTEIKLLEVAKSIKAYRAYRGREFELKQVLYKKIKRLKTGIGGMQKIMPKVKIPEMFRKEDNKISVSASEKKAGAHGLSVEEQLREIQRRLNELQGG